MILHEPGYVDLSTSTGPMRTHLFRPAAEGRYPGVILWSEIFQVTGPIQRAAAFLAGHGFAVAVPEVYHDLEEPGTILPYDAAGAERGNLHKVSRPLSAWDSDAAAAVEFLLSQSFCTGQLGTMGICLGGHLAARTALLPEISASICCYATDLHQASLGEGKADDTLARIGESRAEFLLLWGRQDPHIPRSGRLKIQQALEDGGCHYSWHEFNAQHAFLRDEGARYDPELAALTWSLILAVLRRCLGRD